MTPARLEAIRSPSDEGTIRHCEENRKAGAQGENTKQTQFLASQW